MTEQEISVKFNALAKDVVSEAKCKEVASIIMNIEKEPNVTRLMKAMTA
jgi:hypothetical protein